MSDDINSRAVAFVADEIIGCSFDLDDKPGAVERAREIVKALGGGGVVLSAAEPSKAWQYWFEPVASDDLHLSDLSKYLQAASPPPWRVGPAAETAFNKLGQAGWELAAIVPGGSGGDLVAVFKRLAP